MSAEADLPHLSLADASGHGYEVRITRYVHDIRSVPLR